MKCLLKWQAEIHTPIACPDKIKDPYTGEISSMSCAVYHYRVEQKDMSKEFESEKEAQQFIDNAPPSCSKFILREI